VNVSAIEERMDDNLLYNDADGVLEKSSVV